MLGMCSNRYTTSVDVTRSTNTATPHNRSSSHGLQYSSGTRSGRRIFRVIADLSATALVIVDYAETRRRPSSAIKSSSEPTRTRIALKSPELGTAAPRSWKPIDRKTQPHALKPPSKMDLRERRSPVSPMFAQHRFELGGERGEYLGVERLLFARTQQDVRDSHHPPRRGAKTISSSTSRYKTSITCTRSLSTASQTTRGDQLPQLGDLRTCPEPHHRTRLRSAGSMKLGREETRRRRRQLPEFSGLATPRRIPGIFTSGPAAARAARRRG